MDSHTVKARLPAKHVTFLRHLDPGTCPVLSKQIWEDFYLKGKFSEVLQPGGQNRYGLGPFQVKTYTPGEKIVFARNPSYWRSDGMGTRLPYLDEIVFLVFANQDQIQLRIENGEIDTYQDVRAIDVEPLKQKAEQLRLKVVNVGPTYEMEGFFFNQNRGVHPETKQPYVDPIKLSWFTDINFRKAVSHALDRNALVKNVLFGHGMPAYGPESPGNIFWFDPNVPKYPYDLQKARSLLKQSGFVQKQTESGKPELFDRNGNRVKFSLHTNAGNSERNGQCILIVSDLAKLGMEIQYSALDFSTLVHLINKTHQYDAVLLGLNRNDPDPSYRQNMVFSSGSMHFWWPRQEKPFTPWEERMDELMRLTQTTAEQELRKSYYSQVQRILAEQQPMIYTFHPFGFVCARTNIGNLKPVVTRHRTLWNAEELYLQ
jgi:peptide/nickel transport system substrate-binding protein